MIQIVENILYIIDQLEYMTFFFLWVFLKLQPWDWPPFYM